MSFSSALERLVENKIQAAMEEGAFDNLSGQGKPLDLDAYFATAEDVRVGYAVLKSADCAPLAVTLRQERSALQTALAATMDDAQRARLQSEIQTLTLKLALLEDAARTATWAT